MPNLEFAKYNFNFKWMLKNNPECSFNEYFDNGVFFSEPKAPIDFKNEILQSYPESQKSGQARGLSLVELMNKRV